MAKNYMADVAKMLGVELGEEFKIEGHEPSLYKLSEEGMMLKGVCGWERVRMDLEMVLNGQHKIKKLPWKPKRGGTYCYVYWQRNLATNKWEIGVAMANYYDSYQQHNFCVDTGNCFRTSEEAEAQKYEIFKRLTGKEWSEAHGDQSE